MGVDNKNSFNEIEISNLLKLKIGDTITVLYCEILSGSCKGAVVLEQKNILTKTIQ